MLKTPERGAVLAAFPWKEGDDAARAECEICSEAVGLDPANVPVIKEFELIVICVSCAAIAMAIAKEENEPYEIRGRLIGGVPVDEIARNRKRSN